MSEEPVKKIRLRRADPFDATNILRLIERAHAASGHPYPPINPYKAIPWVTAVIHTGFVAVAEIAGRIVGSVGLGPYQFPWTDEWSVANEWFYVDPKYRRRGTAEKLMELASRWSDKNNARIIIGITDILDAELKDRFVEKMGFTYTGGIFFRQPILAEPDAEVNGA